MLDDNLDLFELLLQQTRERLLNGEDVDHRRVCDVTDRLYKIAGLDVVKVSQTTADGDDLVPTLDQAALAAYVAALPSVNPQVGEATTVVE